MCCQLSQPFFSCLTYIMFQIQKMKKVRNSCIITKKRWKGSISLESKTNIFGEVLIFMVKIL